MTAPLLEVRGLQTWFASKAGEVRAVDGVDLRRRRWRSARVGW